MSIVCLAPHMYAIVKIRVHKAVIQWEQGFIVRNFYWLQYDTDTFSNILADVHDMWGTLLLVVYYDTKKFCFFYFTSCTLIWFIAISSVQREKIYGVNNIK